MIDWLNDNSGAIQAISVIALAIVTAIYAWRTWSISSATAKQAKATKQMAEEAGKQAEASSKVAEGVLRPVMTQCIKPTRPDTVRGIVPLIVHFANIGNGPAINISWSLEGGEWSETSQRVGLGVQQQDDIKGKLNFPLTVNIPTVVVKYEDIGGVRWRSTLKLIREKDGSFGNGETQLECLDRHMSRTLLPTEVSKGHEEIMP